MTTQKYSRPRPFHIENRIWPTREVTRAPVFASTDLRDGNQAFAKPMNTETKLAYFKMLTKIGFKEIEVAFPSASQEDFTFVRRLIEEGHIPEDVTICVLTAMRKDLIDRTLDAIQGARRAIVHCYIATSELHGRFVFEKSAEEIRGIAVEGTLQVIAAAERTGMRDRIRYEFSPEEFSDSDIPTVVEHVKAVKEAWGPCRKGDFIVNLPATVERRPPNQFADMIESFIRAYPYMDETVISVHTHNDQGCAVAAAELALLAGAERVEGTLCGHGERTGNMDIMVMALNFESRGVATGLDFSQIEKIAAFVALVSEIPTGARHPYAGELVFTAFSGTHQDAIRKGFSAKDAISAHFGQGWKMPYLLIDPADLGRNYDAIIRINSQSGKGGICYILEHVYGIELPKGMQTEVGRVVQMHLDKIGGEMTPEEVYRVFMANFVEVEGPLTIKDVYLNRPFSRDSIVTGIELEISVDGTDYSLEGSGNGPIAAAIDALRQCPALPACGVKNYSEHALGSGAEARAIAYIDLKIGDDEGSTYGIGISPSINIAAIRAIGNALNRTARLWKSDP